MTEVLIVALLFLACALAHGMDQPWPHGLVRALGARSRPIVGYTLSLLAVVLAFALVRAAEPGPAAYLLVLAGLTALGTLTALAAPVYPKLLSVLVFVSLLTVTIGSFVRVWS